MKNQYFGDINDYRKYGLLRVVTQIMRLRLLIAWMLTPDDGSSDGKFVTYLDDRGTWSRYDSTLFAGLRELTIDQNDRRVSAIENSSLIPNAHYFSDVVTDNPEERKAWFDALLEKTKDVELVFLDPDNGMEVKSTPYGKRRSSKFLYWREVETLWETGKSLLIYQHFIRERRSMFVKRMLAALQQSTPGSQAEAYSTPNVVFLMVLQPRHQHFHQSIVYSVQQKWTGQIQHEELAN